MKNILIIIAARGGSKSIKDKNIRPLGEKPLMAYTIEQARAWGKAKRIVVSTDSKRIAEMARKYGAETPFLRPKSLATDSAAKGDVIKHAVLMCEKYFKERYAIVVDLDVTSPVRTVEDLDECLKLFLRQRPQTLFSVVKAHKNPYFNMVEHNGNGRVVLCKKLKNRIFRRQDAPTVYAMNASIYFYDRDYVLKAKKLTPFSDNARVYVMNDHAGIDIDRELDFKFIEFLTHEGIVKL